MKKEKINRYGRGIIICYLVGALIGYGISLAFFMLRKEDIGFIFVSISGFLFGTVCVFMLIFGRKIIIDYDKKEIRFLGVWGADFIIIPLFRRIRLEKVSNISNKDNELCFTLLSGKTIGCKIRQSFSFKRASEQDKKIAADLVEKLMTYFFSKSDKV